MVAGCVYWQSCFTLCVCRLLLQNEYTPEQEEDMCREFKWVCD